MVIFSHYYSTLLCSLLNFETFQASIIRRDVSRLSQVKKIYNRFKKKVRGDVSSACNCRHITLEHLAQDNNSESHMSAALPSPFWLSQTKLGVAVTVINIGGRLVWPIKIFPHSEFVLSFDSLLHLDMQIERILSEYEQLPVFRKITM